MGRARCGCLGWGVRGRGRGIQRGAGSFAGDGCARCLGRGDDFGHRACESHHGVHCRCVHFIELQICPDQAEQRPRMLDGDKAWGWGGLHAWAARGQTWGRGCLGWRLLILVVETQTPATQALPPSRPEKLLLWSPGHAGPCFCSGLGPTSLLSLSQAPCLDPHQPGLLASTWVRALSAHSEASEGGGCLGGGAGPRSLWSS